MIIVSQDKTEIINFDNVNTLLATKTGKIMSYENTYRAEDDCSNILGKYKTEERAKEVLKEIIKQYKSVITTYQKGRSDYPIETLIFDRGVFEMPKE